MKKKGITNAYALLGGTQAWKDAGYPMKKGDPNANSANANANKASD